MLPFLIAAGKQCVMAICELNNTTCIHIFKWYYYCTRRILPAFWTSENKITIGR